MALDRSRYWRQLEQSMGNLDASMKNFSSMVIQKEAQQQLQQATLTVVPMVEKNRNELIHNPALTHEELLEGWEAQREDMLKAGLDIATNPLAKRLFEERFEELYVSNTTRLQTEAIQRKFQELGRQTINNADRVIEMGGNLDTMIDSLFETLGGGFAGGRPKLEEGEKPTYSKEDMDSPIFGYDKTWEIFEQYVEQAKYKSTFDTAVMFLMQDGLPEAIEYVEANEFDLSPAQLRGVRDEVRAEYGKMQALEQDVAREVVGAASRQLSQMVDDGEDITMDLIDDLFSQADRRYVEEAMHPWVDYYQTQEDFKWRNQLIEKLVLNQPITEEDYEQFYNPETEILMRRIAAGEVVDTPEFIVGEVSDLWSDPYISQQFYVDYLLNHRHLMDDEFFAEAWGKRGSKIVSPEYKYAFDVLDTTVKEMADAGLFEDSQHQASVHRSIMNYASSALSQNPEKLNNIDEFLQETRTWVNENVITKQISNIWKQMGELYLREEGYEVSLNDAEGFIRDWQAGKFKGMINIPRVQTYFQEGQHRVTDGNKPWDVFAQDMFNRPYDDLTQWEKNIINVNTLAVASVAAAEQLYKREVLSDMGDELKRWFFSSTGVIIEGESGTLYRPRILQNHVTWEQTQYRDPSHQRELMEGDIINPADVTGWSHADYEVKVEKRKRKAEIKGELGLDEPITVDAVSGAAQQIIQQPLVGTLELDEGVGEQTVKAFGGLARSLYDFLIQKMTPHTPEEDLLTPSEAIKLAELHEEYQRTKHPDAHLRLRQYELELLKKHDLEDELEEIQDYEENWSPTKSPSDMEEPLNRLKGSGSDTDKVLEDYQKTIDENTREDEPPSVSAIFLGSDLSSVVNTNTAALMVNEVSRAVGGIGGIRTLQELMRNPTVMQNESIARHLTALHRVWLGEDAPQPETAVVDRINLPYTTLVEANAVLQGFDSRYLAQLKGGAENWMRINPGRVPGNNMSKAFQAMFSKLILEGLD